MRGYIGAIRKDIECLTSAMTSKGIRIPEAYVTIQSDKAIVCVKSGKPGFDYQHDYNFFNVNGDDLKAAFNEAYAWIMSHPSKEEKALSDYLGILAGAVQFAKDNNLEEPFINPIQELAKKLSHNILPSPLQTAGDQ